MRLSDFSFGKNRKPEVMKAKLTSVLNDINQLIASRAIAKATDFSNSLIDIGSNFDSRSLKR